MPSNTLAPRNNQQIMKFFNSKGAVESLDVLIIICSMFLDFCNSSDTITLTRPLTGTQTIVSGNNTFELGFFSPVNNSNRYVGIWYGKIPVRTVVWVANRERPLTDSSGTLMISKEGNPVLLDGQREAIWSSNISYSLTNSSAQLLDSGNIILVDNSNGSIIWESFKDPTNTFPIDMRLGDVNGNEGTLLNSWRSPSDPFPGRFFCGINAKPIPEVFIWNGSQPYWRSGPWNGQIFIGIQHMKARYRYHFKIEETEGSVYMIYGAKSDPMVLYQLLNHDGTLMEMVWKEGKPEPTADWSSIRTDCDVYGKCGAFGICKPSKSPICSCLKGFEPKDVSEWKSGDFSGGCVGRTPLQCERNINDREESQMDGFLKLSAMKVPESAELSSVLEDECEDQCLKECSCTVYSYYTGIGCMLWSTSLIDMQKFSSDGSDLYIRLAYSELGKKRKTKLVILISGIVDSMAIALFTYLLWKRMLRRRDSSKSSSHDEKARGSKFEELPLFSFEKLAIATDNFNVVNELGQGGFGHVYKGKLLDGQEIAVKRLSTSSGQGMEEFMNEVVVISKLQHRNLVRLLGCCIEREEKILVYEYMSNKSLDSFLFDPHKKELLDWSKRLSIIAGICRGLVYLHRDSRLKIIHRDLKASNILLDKELNPKISDFGMARIIDYGVAQANTKRIVGTYGYMAPEYAMQGKFSEKSDVFSFGVLLLEIISGQRNTSFYVDEDSWSLLAYAWKLWNEDNIAALIDPSTSYRDLQEAILKCIHVGLLCVQEFAEDRPTIFTVLSMLSSEIVHLAKPKQPAFTETWISSVEAADVNKCSNGLTVTVAEGR